jgi:hypothetical protein
VTFELKFEPRDLWIGVFWDRRADGLHIYACVLPTIVLHWRLR